MRIINKKVTEKIIFKICFFHIINFFCPFSVNKSFTEQDTNIYKDV